jgi:hypothetical protein
LATRVPVLILMSMSTTMPMSMSMSISFHRSPAPVEAAHQGIDALGGQRLALGGQVGVAVGGEDGVVAQDVLNVLQADAGLDQVGCITVAPIPMSE